MTPETFCQIRQSFSCYPENFGKLFHPPVDETLITYWESGAVPIPKRITAQLLKINTLFQTEFAAILNNLQANDAPLYVKLSFYLCEDD